MKLLPNSVAKAIARKLIVFSQQNVYEIHVEKMIERGYEATNVKKIAGNTNELIQTLLKLKPSSSKGVYLKSITISSTMGPGVSIDTKIF